MINLDCVYLCVKDMNRAIKFYEKFFEMKVSHRYKDRWADFGLDNFTFGLYNPSFDKEKYKKGNNVIPNFYTNNIKKEYLRVKKLNPKTISEIGFVNFMFPYKYFLVEDTEGNVLEIAEWDKK